MKSGRKLNGRLRVLVPPLVVLLLGVVGYLVVVSPERSRASSLSGRITSAESQLSAGGGSEAAKGPKILVANTFRLTKAMPDQLDMAGMILDLSRIAEASNVSFQSVQQSSGAAQATGYQEIPLTLGFQGRFADLTSFMQRLRELVTVRNGELEASGRLFVVDSVEFAGLDDSQPAHKNLVKATLNVSAFIFGSAAGAQPAAAATGGTTPSSTTTSTTTTSTTPSPSPSSSASAAGPTH